MTRMQKIVQPEAFQKSIYIGEGGTFSLGLASVATLIATVWYAIER